MINLINSKYKEYNILIIGVGGTGSHLVSFLSQLIGNRKDKTLFDITLIDKDVIEEHNLSTQKFLYDDIAKNKAEVLSERYNAIYDLNIRYIDKFIEKKRDLINLLCNDKFNIIISCVDNNKARKIIDETFNTITAHKIIYIDTGNNSGSDMINGQTVVGYKEYNKIILPSVGKYYPSIYEEEEIDNILSCGEAAARNIQNIGANITSATVVFNILNNIISFKRIPADFVLFDASNITTSNMKLYNKQLANLSHKQSMDKTIMEYYKMLSELFNDKDSDEDSDIVTKYMNELSSAFVEILNKTIEDEEPTSIGLYGYVYEGLNNEKALNKLKTIYELKNLDFNNFSLILWESHEISIIIYKDNNTVYPKDCTCYEQAFKISNKFTIGELFELINLNKLN